MEAKSNRAMRCPVVRLGDIVRLLPEWSDTRSGMSTFLENPYLLKFSEVTITFRVFPLFLRLAIVAFRGPEGCFSLAIIAFGAFGSIVSKYYYR